MSTCTYCNRAKGKRQCPALGGWICPRCCGEHRLKAIGCPSGCKYLKKHERYQHERAAEVFHRAWLERTLPLYEADRWEVFDCLMELEFSIYRHVQAHPATDDAALVEALQFLQRQLSPIQVVEAVSSGLGKHLAEEASAYLKRRPLLDPEDAQEAVGILLDLITSQAAQGRATLNGLLGHLETHFDLSELESKPAADEVITPHIILPD